MPGDDGRSDVDQVESAGEVLTVGVQHAAPHLVVGFQNCVGAGQLAEQGEIEGISFGGPVQADQQYMSLPVEGDVVEVRR